MSDLGSRLKNPGLAPLIEAALQRTGISIEQLTDARQIEATDWKGTYPTLSQAELAQVSAIRADESYDTLEGSIGSVVGYAAGTWDGGLEAVEEDCEDSPEMARFMVAFVNILIENPRLVGGTTIDVDKLVEIREAIHGE